MTVHYCAGPLEIFIAGESSMRCRRCGWIGWPRQTVDSTTGHILKRWAHPCGCGDEIPLTVPVKAWSYVPRRER